MMMEQSFTKAGEALSGVYGASLKDTLASKMNELDELTRNMRQRVQGGEGPYQPLEVPRHGAPGDPFTMTMGHS